MSERFICPVNFNPKPPEEREVSVIEEDERKMASGPIMKIKTSRPGFEGYIFGYAYLSGLCIGSRWAGSEHVKVFLKIMEENNIEMKDVCNKCPKLETMSKK